MARAYSRVIWQPGREDGFKLSMKRDGGGGPVELPLRVGGFFAGYESMKDLKKSMLRQNEGHKRKILAPVKGKKRKPVAAGGTVRGDTGREHEESSAMPGPSPTPCAAEPVRVGRRRRGPRPWVVESDEEGPEPPRPTNLTSVVISPLASLSCSPPAAPGGEPGIEAGNTPSSLAGKERLDDGSGVQRKQNRKQQHRVRFAPDLVQSLPVPHAGGEDGQPQTMCDRDMTIKGGFPISPSKQPLKKNQFTKDMEEKMMGKGKTPQPVLQGEALYPQPLGAQALHPQPLGAETLYPQPLGAEALYPQPLGAEDLQPGRGARDREEEDLQATLGERIRAACEMDISMREVLTLCPPKQPLRTDLNLSLTKRRDLGMMIAEGETPQSLVDQARDLGMMIAEGQTTHSLLAQAPQPERPCIDPTLRVRQVLKRKRGRRP